MSAASARAKGIEAAEVLPVRSSTDDDPLVGDAEATAGGVDDPLVGLVGDDEVEVGGRHAGPFERPLRARSTMTRTARRKTSRPSISIVPPTSA